MKPSFAIVGCGRVGTSLARIMAVSGYLPVGFSSRSLESAKRAAEAAGFGGAVSEKSWEITPEADIVLITTPDSAIGRVAGEISKNRALKDNAVVLHCSGALSSAELVTVKSVGAVTGSLHPLQSFADDEMETNPFEGIMMGIEGEEGAMNVARRIATDLGARPFEIRTDGKILYHASAVVASNYLVTLMNLAFQLLYASGVRVTDVFQILEPLIHGTLSNIEGAGIPRALTGPIARGDVDVVRSHLAEIGQKAPTLLELYRALGRQTINIARAKGTLPDDAAGELIELLSGGSVKSC